MSYAKLTKRESEIMEILWDNNNAMSANDIMISSNNISLATIQQSLQKLLKMNYVYVSGIGIYHSINFLENCFKLHRTNRR